ncbi:MAG: Choline-sulfatase [Myxococcaceae bacterium]|nr:Choline-sulfatase [Myxococcaceae bacterium]
MPLDAAVAIPPSAPLEAGAKATGTDAGPALAAATPPPGLPADLDVIVISVDSLRADMPWAGYPRAIAPRLTELEKRSVSYTRAYSMSSYTSMSLGGFLGGKLPSEMKRSGFFFGSYAKDNVMFPELLQAKGVRTMSAHAHGYFSSAGFDQGFDVYQVVPGIKFDNTTDNNVTSPQHEAMAEKMLDDPRLEVGRFFAWFHFLDPHDQYLSHEKDGIPPYGKSLRDRYDAEVTFTDRYLGKLLDFIAGKPWGKRTAIIVTADHGEAFGEHGITRHAHEVWEELIHVPLFVHVPGLAPREIAASRGHADVAPTVLELLGAQPIASLHGTSLVSELRGGASATRDVIADLPEDEYNERRRALIHDRIKIIAFGNDVRYALYDLEADPKESDDLMRKRPDLADEMRRRYKEASKGIVEVAPRGGVPTHDR